MKTKLIQEMELKQDTENMLQMIPSSHDRRKFRGLIQRIKTFESKKYAKAISQSKEELVDKVIELSSKYWIDKYVGTEMPLIVNKVQFKKFILEDLNKKVGEL